MLPGTTKDRLDRIGVWSVEIGDQQKHEHSRLMRNLLQDH